MEMMYLKRHKCSLGRKCFFPVPRLKAVLNEVKALWQGQQREADCDYSLHFT